MREILYKNSFFRYCGAINLCGGRRMPLIAPFVAFYFLMVISLASGISSMNFIGAGTAAIACLLFFTGALIGAYRNASPNPAKLMPISGKRRCVYDFLIALYYAFIALTVVALVTGVVALIAWVAVSASGGAESGGEENPFTLNCGVYGGIFSAAYVLIMYSAGMISGFFKRRKQRNIFLAVLVICITLGLLFTGLPHLVNGVKIPDYPPFGSPFSSLCYESMKLPWLCSLLWCLVAVVSFASAVYTGIKYNKPEKY